MGLLSGNTYEAGGKEKKSQGERVEKQMKSKQEEKMRVEWFENQDNVVYANIDEFADNFGKETGISDLRSKIEEFRANPVKEGLILRGKKRSALKLFIPDMVFDKHIDMGESVWVYIGESYPAYCLYWSQEEA